MSLSFLSFTNQLINYIYLSTNPWSTSTLKANTLLLYLGVNGLNVLMQFWDRREDLSNDRAALRLLGTMATAGHKKQLNIYMINLQIQFLKYSFLLFRPCKFNILTS